MNWKMVYMLYHSILFTQKEWKEKEEFVKDSPPCAK